MKTRNHIYLLPIVGAVLVLLAVSTFAPAQPWLTNAPLIDVWRGANSGLSGSSAKSAGGRKWFSVANSDGQSLSSIQELKYDDGSQFFSPSSLDRLFRSQYTGKLYWFGNISAVIPSGISPRNPLVIAEFDETHLALKKSTVSVIADHVEGEPDRVRYSNFSLLENPQTHQIEIFLTNYGVEPEAQDPSSLGGDSLKYTITFKKPGDYNADGTVDAADYVVWRKTLNQQVALPNEMTTLGSVTQEDYQVWRAAFGASQSAASTALAVPEPSTCTPMSIGSCSCLLALISRTRRAHARDVDGRIAAAIVFVTVIR